MKSLSEHSHHSASSHTAVRERDEESTHKKTNKVSSDTEYEETEHTQHQKKKKKAGRNKFPVGGLVLMFALILLGLAAAYFGQQYYTQYRSLKTSYEGNLQTLNAELQEAQAALRLADPDSEAHEGERAVLTEELLRDAQEKLSEVQKESAELDSAISEAEKTVAELEQQEDFEYYKEIYDAYEEGRDYVEGLLSGN